ncbi:MAG TPA: IS110 family transposase [Candidatus Brocadiaceae bacterium]
MKELKSCVGIDVSKDSFEVCIKQLKDERGVIKATHSFQNEFSGFESLLNWTLRKVSNPIFVMETTGVYHEDLTHYLYENGQKVSVVLANKMKHFAKSLNMKTKTDKADAQMIAQYGLERPLEWWKPMMPQMKNLRDLCRERLSLKKDLVRCKCQIHGLKHAHSTLDVVLQVKEQQIGFLESNIQIIENEIIRLTKEDKEFSLRVKNIETIKGLRLLTIVTVLCETNGFAQFNNIRQVVSYAGLDIAERQSGLFKGKTRISKKGNARIRECMYMPALSATSYNEPIKALYQRIVERNPTIKRKGVIAGMRKLLILIFVLWKKNEAYNAEYQWDAH